MTESELPGQGQSHHNRQQRVGIHLVVNDKLIIKLNGTIYTNQTERFPIVSQKEVNIQWYCTIMILMQC